MIKETSERSKELVMGALAGSIVSAALTKGNAPVFINVVLSIMASIVSGWLFSMLLGVACIKFKADQTITGTALNIMSTATAVVIARMYTKTTSSEIGYQYEMFSIFNDFVSIFFFMMLIIVFFSYIILFKTKEGMHLMACGEHPQAADSVGINVFKQRYIGVSISGILAGLGGFAYITQSASHWDFKYGVAGFGFLALAVMIFGQWKPIRILLAALIFGLFQTISTLYVGKFGIPSFVYKMLPYIVCMVVLAITSKNSKAPKAEGQPYDKGLR